MSWGSRSPAVAIIGSGFAGLAMAVQLKRAGVDSFTIFEKGVDVGGIWRDNTYPGCGCDVPSHLYSYSFEKYRSSTRRYPEQPEILDYLRQVAKKHGLRPHLRLNCEIASARYDEATSRWTIGTDGFNDDVADLVRRWRSELDAAHTTAEVAAVARAAARKLLLVTATLESAEHGGWTTDRATGAALLAAHHPQWTVVAGLAVGWSVDPGEPDAEDVAQLLNLGDWLATRP